MNPEEQVAQGNKRAKDNFKIGLNCAECVQETLLYYEPKGLPDDCRGLMSRFGGGSGVRGDKGASQPFQENAEGLN